MCVGKYEPHIQKDNGTDTEGYHTYQVSVGDNQTYPVKYKISSNATLESIFWDKETPSFNIVIREVSQGGNLTIQLPTKLLGVYNIGYFVATGTMCADIVYRGAPAPIESNSNFTIVSLPLMNYDGVRELIMINGNHATLEPNFLQNSSNNLIVSSPLKQFKAGIATHYIKCKESLHLIIKAEDGTPACVKIETGIKLVNRGWATTFGTGITAEEYDTTCDTPFLASKSDIAVLYVPTNSLGKICLRYSNPNDAPQSIYPPRIFDTNDPTKPPVVRQIWTYSSLKEIPKDNVTTVAWFVKAGNQTGFYGLSLPSCVPTPFAIGYNNNSQMTSKNFPFLGKLMICDPSTPDIRIDGLTGIGVKYIPYP